MFVAESLMRSNEAIVNEIVKKFLGKVNPTGWRTNRKAALDEFGAALMKEGEQLAITDGTLITQLFVGCKQFPKGLLKICGEHSVSNIVGPSLTRASIMALRLLSKLLDPSVYSGASHILEHLKNIPVSALALPNFAHHLIRDHTDGESGPHVFEPPMRVVSTFLCYIPNLHLTDFIADDWARYFFLRRCIGYHYQSPNDKFWTKSVQAPNFSHSMVTEFLTTSKHRMGREVWLKNIGNYLVKCKPILSQEIMEVLMAGISKTNSKGLIKMCNYKKSYSVAAKEVLAQLLDNQLYPDSGRIADFLLEHRDLLSLLNYPQVFEKRVHVPIDTKIYNILMTRAKVGEVKDVLILLNGEETQSEAIPLDPNRSRRNTSLDSLKKTYKKMHRKTFSSVNDVSWGDKNSQGSYPSVLSKLDDDAPPPLPQSAPTSLEHIPYSPSSYPVSPDMNSSFPPSFPASPSSSPPSSSSPRTSDEFESERDQLSLTTFSSSSCPVPPTPLVISRVNNLIPPEISPRSRLGTESFRAQDMVIAALEHFFEESSPLFSRLEYRRLLIFLMSIVTSQSNEAFTSVESLFSELGLDSNPQYKTSVSSLFETLDELGINFNEEFCGMWTGSLMREIAVTERNLDP